MIIPVQTKIKSQSSYTFVVEADGSMTEITDD